MPFFYLEIHLANLEQQLIDIIKEPTNALGFELIGVEFIRSKHPVLRIFIDHENGISVDDCADVSRQISSVLDVEDPINVAYTLEVSSPGMDRPLFTLEHYQQFIDHEITFSLRIPVMNRRNWKGVIKKIDGEMITIAIDNQENIFAFNNIQKANIVPKF